MKCLICNQETNYPKLAFLSHFKPYEPNGFRFFKGNRDAFGFWAAVFSCLYSSSPLLSTLRFWKYRKMQLDFGPDPMVLHALAIEGEKVKKQLDKYKEPK